MDPLENQLKQALQPRDPAPDFTARVMARIAEQAREPWWRQLFQPGWGGRMALAGGLAALLMISAGVGYQQRQERLRGEAARAQLLQALQITGLELNKVRQVVRGQ